MIGKQIPAGTGYHNIKNITPIDIDEIKEDNLTMDESTAKLFDDESDVI